MTEEEKKTIELLKTYENKLVYEIEDKDKKAVKIVLNLIEKLQEENKVFKRALDKETADRSNDLLELQKKDKMIDLMALVILNYDDQLVINRYKNIDEVKEEFKKITKEKGE